MAESLARTAVSKKLAACANLAYVKSFYWWKNSLRAEDEALIVFKTTQKNASKLKAYLEEEHPYETPEIVQVEPSHVNQKYLLWVLESVAG